MPTSPATAPAAPRTAPIQDDPVSYLREVQARARALSKYRLTLYRQERLGLFQTLGPLERIAVTFRADPFSVRLVWDDPDSQLYESVFIAGPGHGKLVVRERKGWLTFPPTVRWLDPADPVRWRRSKRPITEFGLAATMDRTLSIIEDAPVGAPVQITYTGIEMVPRVDRQAHHFVLIRATTPETPCPRQDLWIDTETDLPTGTALTLPDGRLDALYLFADITPDESIGEQDFRMDMPGAAAPAPVGPAGSADTDIRRRP